MTTGTRGNPTGPSAGMTGVYDFSSWSGTDGKYEVYQGSRRSKWNSYSAEKAGLLISVGKVGFRCPLGHTELKDVPYYYWRNPVIGASLPSFSSADRLTMIAKLLEKVKGHSFNAAVNLAQSGQVANMVVSNLSKLGRSIMALKHGDIRTAARHLGASPRPSKLASSDISGRWLELQYGWLPMISDCYNAAKAFEAISAGPQKSRFSTSKLLRGTQDVGGATGVDRQRLDMRRTLKYTVEVQEELPLGRQLGLTDPLSVAWELIPYSFVVDWFVPIGTYFSVLNQLPSVKGRWMVSEAVSSSGVLGYWTGGTMPFCSVHSGQQYTHIASFGSVTYRGSVVTRDSLSSPPKVPTPSFKLAGAVHGKRIANAIALASQRFLR